MVATVDVGAVLLDAGKRLLTGALTGFTAIGPVKFRIGDTAGFTPDKTDTDIRGNLVFEGLSGLTQTRRIADDTVRYTLVITEEFGPFDIGNIVLFCSHADAEAEPMVSVVLPFKVRKNAGNVDLGDSLDVPTPGNRFVINITIQHSVEGSNVTVNVTDPQFSSLPFYATRYDIPAYQLNPWNQFVVHNDDRIGTPTLVTKRSDGSYWGIPFWQNFRSSKFGIFDGGVAGDGRAADNFGYAWGNFYLTIDSLYDGALGGSNYNDPPSSYVGVVGGAAY